MTESTIQILFYTCAAGLVLILEVAVWRGIFYKKTSGEQDPTELNRWVYADQIESLKDDLEAGRISRKQHDEDLEEIEHRALEENSIDSVGTVQPDWVKPMTWAILFFLPCLAVFLYLQIANPALKGYNGIPGSRTETSFTLLGNYLKESPKDVRAWLHLSNYEADRKNFRAALDAMNRAFDLSPNGVAVETGHILNRISLMLETGDPTLKSKIFSEIDRALTIHPSDERVLELGGMAAYSFGDYRRAVSYWSSLLERIPSESPQATRLLDAISEAKNRQFMNFDGLFTR